jgi:predicted nuclease of predicted toxin-antitoxin system
LIDENLSTALPRRAHARGYEATQVTHLGLEGAKDWTLMEVISKHDWVLVTNNAVEFRGRYRKIEFHPGVVFIVPNVRRAGQIELFEAALDEVQRGLDLINTAIDVDYDHADVVTRRYQLP